MGRTAVSLGVLAGCLGAAWLLYTGLSAPGFGEDGGNAALTVVVHSSAGKPETGRASLTSLSAFPGTTKALYPEQGSRAFPFILTPPASRRPGMKPACYRARRR